MLVQLYLLRAIAQCVIRISSIKKQLIFIETFSIDNSNTNLYR